MENPSDAARRRREEETFSRGHVVARLTCRDRTCAAQRFRVQVRHVVTWTAAAGSSGGGRANQNRRSRELLLQPLGEGGWGGGLRSEQQVLRFRNNSGFEILFSVWTRVSTFFVQISSQFHAHFLTFVLNGLRSNMHDQNLNRPTVRSRNCF
jgi:hypothetical protein